jgi:zeaxanthin glucosyltransferase
MAKILFLVLPLPSHINIHSLLARALQERGHEVVFGVMKDAQARIEAYGFQCLPLFAERLPAGLMKEWLTGEMVRKTWKQQLRFYLDERRKIIDHENFVGYLTKGGYQEFLDAVKVVSPDLILVDIGLHTYWPLMARMTGLPCVYTSALLPIVQDPVIPPVNSLLRPAKNEEERKRIRQTWDSYFKNRWLRTQAMRLVGIPDPIANFRKMARATGCPDSAFNARTLMFPQLDFPVMLTCPKEFEFPEALNRPEMHYVEALINPDRPEPAFPWEKLDPAKKLIFCSLGSVAYNRYFFQNVLDAIAREPSWQVVINTGPTISQGDFERVPTGAILVNGAPQLALLRKAKAMINHGGINSVRECIYYGVPQLVFPLFFDQFGAAVRVEFHGLGITGSFAAATPDQLHSWLKALLSEPGFRERSETMSTAFQDRERERPSVAFIEKCLAKRPVAKRP